MMVSHELTRRDFVTAAGALAGAALLPASATAQRPPVEGTVILFQGDSITDGGRNRAASEPNQPVVLRCGAVDDRWFPEFDQRRAAAQRVAQQARAAFVPLQSVFDDLARRAAPQYWAADGVHPTPAGHAVIAERWRRAAHL